MAAKFTRQRPPAPRPAALGVLFAGPRPYGALAAATRPGRRHGGAVVPVLHGLFSAGRVKQISSVAATQNYIPRG